MFSGRDSVEGQSGNPRSARIWQLSAVACLNPARETQMRRREFVAVLGAAAAWPGGVSAQQPSIPVIGFVTVGNGPTLSDGFWVY
jgi:hypothetical protein